MHDDTMDDIGQRSSVFGSFSAGGRSSHPRAGIWVELGI